MKKINKPNLFDLILNLVLFIFVVVGLIDQIVFGVPFSSNGNQINLMRYFTTLSNLFLGLTAFYMLVFNIIKLFKKDAVLPKVLCVIRLTAVVSTTITFLTVFCFLAPTYQTGAKDGFYFLVGSTFGMFSFHCFSPILGIVGVIFFEHESNLKKIDSLFAMLPTGLYGIVYCINVLGTKVWEDFYHFNIVINGFPIWWVILILMLVVSLGLGFGYIFLNAKIRDKFLKTKD